MRTRGGFRRGSGLPLGRAALVMLLGLGLPASCGGIGQNTTVLGSESHFLARCSDACAGGLECIGGVCTRSCTPAEDTCGELDSRAACLLLPSGEASVCDVPCSENDACEGLGTAHGCVDGVCRVPDASSDGRPDALACESHLDSSPPPVVRGVTILNTSGVTLYVQTHAPGCPGLPTIEPALVRVSPIGEGDSAPELNIYGVGCAASCQAVMENGWTGLGEGGTRTDCPELPCPPAAPLPWVPIEPGQSLFEAARLQYLPERLPRGCAEGIVGEAINCQARRIPAEGAYFIAVVVSDRAGCETSNCPGQIFSRAVGNYFQADHTLEITDPSP